MANGKTTTSTASAQRASAALKQALEANDPDAIVAAYADDAVVIAYSDHRRGYSRSRITGHQEIKPWIYDYVARKYEHTIEAELVCDDGFAWTERWTSPTGDRLISTSIYTVSDGKITQQHGTETSG